MANDKKISQKANNNIVEGIRLTILALLFSFLLLESMRLYCIWYDINIASNIFNCDKKQEEFEIEISTSESNFSLTFKPNTYFFLYSNGTNNQKIGYYWKYSSIFNDTDEIPFPYSGDIIIPNKIKRTIEHSDSMKKIERELSKLVKFPLSTGGKIKLTINTYLYQLSTGHKFSSF